MNDPYRHVARGVYRARWFDRAMAAAGLLPRGLLAAAGRAAGRAYADRHPEAAAVTLTNVRRVVPAYSGGAGAVYASFGETLADYFHFGRAGDARIAAAVGERRGFANLHRAHREGRGAILANLHFSFFELGGWVMKDLGMPVVVLTRPEPEPELSLWRAKFRARWGMETIEVGADPFVLLEVLARIKAGQMVALLVDRPLPQHRVEAEVGGVRTVCSNLMFQLAAKSGAPILPMAVWRVGGKYHFHAGAPLPPSPGNPGAAASAFWADLLPLVAAHPEQYHAFEEMEP